MIECGKVIKLNKNNMCTVSFDRKSACDQCRMCAVNKSGKTVEITIKNILNAEIGDTVEVLMGNNYVMTAVLIVYVIPLITVAIGVVIGSFFDVIAQTFLALFGLILGFIIAITIDRKIIRKKKGFVPTLNKIISKVGDDNSQNNEVS